MLGGWLTLRSQDRNWQRDHQRQWRDIRLSAYTEYLNAFREFIAYLLRPSIRVVAAPRPVEPYDLMPFFDEAGSIYRERLEATKTAIRLISSDSDVVQACNVMVHQARRLAAERAEETSRPFPPSGSRRSGRPSGSSCSRPARSSASPVTSRSLAGPGRQESISPAVTASRR